MQGRPERCTRYGPTHRYTSTASSPPACTAVYFSSSIAVKSDGNGKRYESDEAPVFAWSLVLELCGAQREEPTPRVATGTGWMRSRRLGGSTVVPLFGVEQG